MTQAPTGQVLASLSSGFEIRADRSLLIQEPHLPLVRRAIPRVSSYDRMIPVNVDMGDIIGESPIVVLRDGDYAYWGIPEGAPNRPENWIRLVAGRTPERTSVIGLQMNYERMGGSDDFPYDGRLVAYSIGPFPQPVPLASFVDPAYVARLVTFWKTHAWVPSAIADRIIATKGECPWGVKW